MAYLATLPKGPNNYHPFRKTEKAIIRRNWIIGRMVINGYVTKEDAELAKKRPLDVNPRPFGARIFAAEYFAEEVRREILSKYGEKKLLEGGLVGPHDFEPTHAAYGEKSAGGWSGGL